MSMLFLSRLPRWLLGIISLVGGVILAFGNKDKWRHTPSLHWLAHALPFVPLQAYGILLAVDGLLLLSVRTRPLGYALGAMMFALFSVSLLVTIHQAGPKAILFVVAALQLVCFNILAISVALDEREASVRR